MAKWRGSILTFALLAVAAEACAGLPVVFEQRPDAPADWPWFARTPGFTVLLGRGEAVFRTGGHRAIRIRFGAAVAPEPLDRMASVSNFYLGSDRTKWRSGVPQYARIRYRSIYPGIDLVFYGRGAHIEFDFIVSPGANPDAIHLKFDRPDAPRIERSDVVVGGVLRIHKPVLYQDDGTSVQGAFARRGDGIAFRTGRYDRTRTLVIDPVLSYATYAGGSAGDAATGMAVDAAGAAYITGSTSSTNFPATPGAYQRTKTSSANTDVFVARLNAAGTALDFATYLGGSGQDTAHDIALDSAGNAYITGSTTGGFPTTAGAYRTSTGAGEVIVAKLSPSGSLLYSTAIGSGAGYGIAVTPAGNAWITGFTAGSYPVTSGAFQTIGSGQGDAFVTQLNAQGSALVVSTLIGSSCQDYGWSIALTASGEPVIAGSTCAGPFASRPFPVSASAFQRTPAGGYDAFVARFSAAGNSLVFSTLLGGSSDDFAYDIAVDSLNHSYVAGMTASWYGDLAPFPATFGAFQTIPGRGFLTKLNPGGSGLVYSTFFGSDVSSYCYDPLGRSCGGAFSVALDALNQAHVAGAAWGYSSLPITPGAVQPGNAGGADGFLLRFDPSGSSVTYGTFFGGSGEDAASAVAVDTAGNMFLAGTTASMNLPVVAGSAWTTSAGDRDAWIAKLQLSGECTVVLSETSRTFSAAGGTGSFSVTAPAGCDWTVSTTAESSAWLTLTSPAGGTGSSVITYSLAANASALPRSGAVRVGSRKVEITQESVGCTYALSPASAAFGPQGGTGQVSVTAPAGCNWTASAPGGWVSITGAAGSAVTYAVDRNAATTSRSVTLTIAGRPFAVTQSPADSERPFGYVDTPADNITGVAGAVGITGWALDNVGVTRVGIWRDAVGGEPAGARIYIGEATFVDGARPDVAAAYPNHPLKTRAGWGYLMLTNMLPSSSGTGPRGDGKYRLYAIAEDAAGNSFTLGSRSMTCANSAAVRPFGTIDTPGPGATISGTAYKNWGWALTPLPFSVPDGSTIRVFVDGKLVGHPSYGVYRPDIAGLFAGYSNAGGAVGLYMMDTTQLSNGLHSLAWAVTDSGGRTDGIGSRLFNVSNPPAAIQSNTPAVKASRATAWSLRQGYDPAARLRPLRAERSAGTVRLARGERIEIHAPEGIDQVCLLIDGGCSRLPAGSSFDSAAGVLYWQADPVFSGAFDLRFSSAGSRPVTIRVRIGSDVTPSSRE